MKINQKYYEEKLAPSLFEDIDETSAGIIVMRMINQVQLGSFTELYKNKEEGPVLKKIIPEFLQLKINFLQRIQRNVAKISEKSNYSGGEKALKGQILFIASLIADEVDLATNKEDFSQVCDVLNTLKKVV